MTEQEFTDEDMAQIGRNLMAAIEAYAPDKWSPTDCPSEIVCDLHTALEEARAAGRAEVASAGKPIAWIRRHPDGALSNDILLDNSRDMDDARRNSGAWVPLRPADLATPAPAPLVLSNGHLRAAVAYLDDELPLDEEDQLGREVGIFKQDGHVFIFDEECPEEGYSLLEPVKPGEAKRVAWSKTPPTEQGWYWHWDGNADTAPFILSILYSGTNGKCFVSIGNPGVDNAIFCDVYGGYWAAIDEPPVPDLREEAEIMAAVARSMARMQQKPTRCRAGKDGECNHPLCPQIVDGEPAKSGRHCPIDIEVEE